MLSVGAIRFEDRFCDSKKGEMGEVGWHSHDMTCTWRLSWLAVERPWSALAGPFLYFFAQTGIETAPLPSPTSFKTETACLSVLYAGFHFSSRASPTARVMILIAFSRRNGSRGLLNPYRAHVQPG